MTAGIRAPVTRVAPSRRGTAPRWRARGRAARIPRAARPDDGAEEKDGDGRDAWVGRDGRDASTSSAAAATVAAVASASLLFAIPAIPAQQLALAMATEQPATMEAPSTTTATGMSAARDDRDRRTASRMVDMFETLSREEQQALTHLREKIFAPAGEQTWENVEIGAYWETVGKRLLTQQLYNNMMGVSVAMIGVILYGHIKHASGQSQPDCFDSSCPGCVTSAFEYVDGVESDKEEGLTPLKSNP